MARIIIETDDGQRVADLDVTNKYGPWSDGADVIEWMAQEIDRALRLEGDEA